MMSGMSGTEFLEAVPLRIGDLLARACPLAERPGLLVALSGGPDSVALLLAAHRWHAQTGLPLAAAHFNHKLRGRAAEDDVLFCRDLCASLEIPLHLEAGDPRPVANRRGKGLEEAARYLRFAFFQKILAGDPQLHCVAKAHHRDDQVETLVMRFFRGTGPGGLRGIRPIQDSFIHPLLDFARADILAFLEKTGQPWRTDASNLEGDNLRARLRREFLPLARELFGTGCEEAPLRLSQLLSQDEELLASQAEQALDDLSLGGNALSAEKLTGLPPALAQRVLRRWLILQVSGAEETIAAVHLMNILAWLREGQSGTGWDLPLGRRLIREFDQLKILPAVAGGTTGKTAADFRVHVRPCDGVDDPVALGLGEGPGLQDEAGNWNLSCPARVLQGNLRIRNPRPGDRFQPFGLDGTTKLSDLFREQRIPESRRQAALVVEDDLGILWVVGVSRSERTRLLPTSGRIVTICVADR